MGKFNNSNKLEVTPAENSLAKAGEIVWISDNREECIRKTVALLNSEGAEPLHRPG